MTPEEQDYEWANEWAMLKELDAEEAEYNSWIDSLCQQCMGDREDWHDKLCGDGLCAQCSMSLDQETCQPVAGDPSDGQEIQTQSQVSASAQRGDDSSRTATPR